MICRNQLRSSRQLKLIKFCGKKRQWIVRHRQIRMDCLLAMEFHLAKRLISKQQSKRPMEAISVSGNGIEPQATKTQRTDMEF